MPQCSKLKSSSTNGWIDFDRFCKHTGSKCSREDVQAKARQAHSPCCRTRACQVCAAHQTFHASRARTGVQEAQEAYTACLPDIPDSRFFGKLVEITWEARAARTSCCRMRACQPLACRRSGVPSGAKPLHSTVKYRPTMAWPAPRPLFPAKPQHSVEATPAQHCGTRVVPKLHMDTGQSQWIHMSIHHVELEHSSVFHRLTMSWKTARILVPHPCLSYPAFRPALP